MTSGIEPVIREDYLKGTEPAVQHMFAALEVYRAITPRPSVDKYKKNDGRIHLTGDEATQFLHDEIDAMGLDVAKATLSGGIVQVAYSGIKQYSRNTEIPASCHHFDIPTDRGKAKFCIGREIHSLPIGLIIYAARIQYNHWEEGTPSNPTARAIFRYLSSVRMDDPWHDLVYELDWPKPRPVTHYILQLEFKCAGNQ